jgi:tRNA-dihydrouridine synthase A
VPERLKREHPELTVVLNGGIKTASQVREWLPKFDGVMIGRQVYHEPYLLAELDADFLGPGFLPPSREQVVERYAGYVERMLAEGHRLPLMLRHIQGLFAGLPNARAWRRYLSEHAIRPGAGAEVLRDSLRMFRDAA